MAAPLIEEFDPLREFAGVWTTALANRYLPLRELQGARYECVDGRLVVSPMEAVSNAYGRIKLARLLGPAADAAMLYVYDSVNLIVNPERWINPDLCILHSVPSPEESVWVPAARFTMVIEFVSPSSRKRDRIDKPDVCAKAGVPYFMRIEIERGLGHVEVTLLHLDRKENAKVLAHSIAGQEFSITEPLSVSFDPAVLLEP